MSSGVMTGCGMYTFGRCACGMSQCRVIGIPSMVGAFGPRRFGMTMILIGLITLILATLQYRMDLKRLSDRYGPQPRSLVTSMQGE